MSETQAGNSRGRRENKVDRSTAHDDASDGLSFSIDDSTSVQIVGRNFHDHSVAWHDTNKVLPHLTGDVGHDDVTIFQLYAKLSVCECFDDIAFYLDCFFFGHTVNAFSVLFPFPCPVTPDDPTITIHHAAEWVIRAGCTSVVVRDLTNRRAPFCEKSIMPDRDSCKSGGSVWLVRSASGHLNSYTTAPETQGGMHFTPQQHCDFPFSFGRPARF